jgi:outer membrane protein assembly factor BamD
MIRRTSLLLAALFLASCADKKPEQFTEDKSLYEYASRLYDEKEYTQAIPFFESLKNRFPQSPYLIDSKIKLADAKFHKGDYLEAEMEYDSFRSLHPTNAQVPYAIYQIGRTHYERVPGGIDRDLTHTQQALNSFNELIHRWPQNTYVAKAQPLAEKCKRQLAEREMYVANFYMKQKEYKAAAFRLESMSKDGSFVDLQSEAKYKLGLSYYKLKQMDQARSVLSEVSNASSAGKYRAKAQQLLQKIKL